jgi:hypothetical protein
MSLSKGQTKSSNQQTQQSTSSQAYDPTTLTPLLQNAQKAADVAATPYQAYSGVPLNIDSSAAQGVAGFQPTNVTAGQLSSTDLSPYLNPYTKDVIDTTTGQLARDNQITQLQNDDAATAAHAFGGDGAAVLKSLTQNDYQRNLGATVAGLNQANFTQAQGAAGQDIANRMSAAFANQNAAAQAAQLRLSAGAQLSADQQAQYGAAYQQYLNQQAYAPTMQQLRNQAFGLLPSGPLTTSQSTGQSTGMSSGFNMGVSSSPVKSGS